MDLTVRIGSATFKNPIWIASGVCRTGEEFEEFLDFENVGAVITKTITLAPREGNLPPRLIETPSGLINSIGLANKGVEYFIKESYPALKKLKTKIIVSIAASGKKEFVEITEKLVQNIPLEAIELNLSCPNVVYKKNSFDLISQDPNSTERVVSLVRRKVKGCLLAKLTPNVTRIADIAASAKNGGADAVSLVNTYFAMAVDAAKMKPLLGNVVGGLSGPAIKPMALKAVWDVYNRVGIPIVGIGGIMQGSDVAEFMLCGARAVEVCTANFVDPDRYNKILEEFKSYLLQKKIENIKDLVGKLNVKTNQ